MLRLLEKYKGLQKNPLKSLGKRKSPVIVARILSAVVSNYLPMNIKKHFMNSDTLIVYLDFTTRRQILILETSKLLFHGSLLSLIAKKMAAFWQEIGREIMKVV